MANITVVAHRSDRLSDWQLTNKPIKPGELVFANDDAGALLSLVIGPKNPAAPTTETPFNSVPARYLLDQDDKDKLDALIIETGATLVDKINQELQTDLATVIGATNLTYNGLATILDQGPIGVLWRTPPAVSFNGRPIDSSGDLSPASGDYGITDIVGLVTALSGKTDVGHGHPTSAITGLDAALAARVSTTTLGAPNGTATLGEDGYLAAAQRPPGLGNDVSSVHGRTGAVVSANGDYNAGQITYTPSGFVAATTVQAAINELIAEVVPLSQKDAANGVPGLDGAGKLSTSVFPVAASSVLIPIFYPQFVNSQSFTPPNSTTPSDPASQIQHYSVDLTNAKETYIMSRILTAATGATGCKLVGEYSLDGGSTWSLLNSQLLIDGSAGTGPLVGTAVTVPSGARVSSLKIRTAVVNGNGTATANLSSTGLYVVYETPINNGSLTGSEIRARIDAVEGNTGWRDPAGTLANASVTMAKLENFDTQTAPLRISAGSGPLEKAGQAQWRTFLDSVVSIHGRKGVVVAQAGDYTADQITPTATRVFLTPAQADTAVRGGTLTEFTSSSIVGFHEVMAVFSGTGTAVLSATLTNASTTPFVSIINCRTVPINIVPQSPKTMANANGSALTTYSLQPGDQVCAWRVGTSVWRLGV